MMERTRCGIVVAVLAFGLACHKGASPPRPDVPHDKVEVVDGWLRLKQVRGGHDQGLGVMGPGETQYVVLGTPNSFMVDNGDLRFNRDGDYVEIRMGTRVTL